MTSAEENELLLVQWVLQNLGGICETAAPLKVNELLAMVVEPLPTLAVGEEAVARSPLGRALEWCLEMETWSNMENVSRSIFTFFQ